MRLTPSASLLSPRLRTAAGALLLAAGVVLALAFTALPAEAQKADPWATLTDARSRMSQVGFQRAKFTQTYVPAGFSQGEEESGVLALGLPDCLRWDYLEPYPKSFLVCGSVASYWNPEDGTGQRRTIDRENEPGLDLLLLSVEALKSRYEAEAEVTEKGRSVAVHLTPRETLQSLKTATLTVNPASGNVDELSFVDQEGNRTRFVLSSYESIKEAGLFAPPKGIRWNEEEGR